jgi:predicted RNase H-like HicB family nuclease
MLAIKTQESIRVLQDLRDAGLRLVAPLYITIEEEAGTVVASNVDLDVFGYGDTEAEALQDLREVIVETYFDLKANQNNLGPYLQTIWNYLNRIVLELQLHAA